MEIDFFLLILLIGSLGWIIIAVIGVLAYLIVFTIMFPLVVLIFLWGLPRYLMTRGEKNGSHHH